MFFTEHGLPHFHAAYAEFKISVEIESERVRGLFPSRGQRLVLEWLRLHRHELLENWERAHAGKGLQRISPLE